MVQPHKAKETNYLLPIKTLVRNMVNGTCSQKLVLNFFGMFATNTSSRELIAALGSC